MDAAAYGRALKKLLPPGPLFRLTPDSTLSKLFHGLGDELARVEARGWALIEETDPRTATETLPEWERAFGLPDADILTIPATNAERQVAVTQKVLRTGGQSRAYFISLALACGWTVTIDDAYGLTVARAGRFRCGDRLYGTGWAFVWRVDVSPGPATGALTTTELEAVLNRVKPAHTLIVFNYL